MTKVGGGYGRFGTSQVTEDEMGRVCSTNKKRNAWKILIGKPQGEGLSEQLNIGRIIMGVGGMEWIDVTK
jgi:hypothetical protein